MRIGIDARLYRETGVGRYIRNLIHELSLRNDRNEYYIYLYKKEFSNFKVPDKRFVKKLLDIPWHSFREQIIVPVVLTKDNLDIAHFPYFNVPVLYPKRYVLTVHDLIINHFNTGRASTRSSFLYKAKRLGYKIIMFLGIKRASFIFTISDTTKKEVIDHYHIDEKKLAITYDSLDTIFKVKATKEKPEKIYNFSYILYVGNAYPHKNIEGLIEAFRIIRKKSPVKMVLAGDDPYFYRRLKKTVNLMNLNKDIIFYGNAGDSELVSLYRYASCLVMPSFMEGFGLPVVESIFCNTLPVVSNIPVFNELWGKDMIYFDQNNPSDMAEKISYAISISESDRKKIIRKLSKRLVMFSWEKTADITAERYLKIIS